jgi:DNA polymerase-3 subunit gamma/tau
VPATIKSRCQQFNFRLIPIETIKGLLAQACREMEIEAEDEALFWIARESTGSLRDAYTLFDQVVSFSDGNIRSDIIREKLGLVGLERLNEFADACAANDVAGALAKIDELIGDGVAVEQFVTDLAGYYHSLFLLKSGVTREALLGYPPERFSKKALEKLDVPKLAYAGELLFDLHRDIRYSVSPRFELETLASKLCWLDRWISPAELAEAVNKAGAILKGGLGRPLAQGVENPRTEGPRVENPKVPGVQREIKDEIKPGQSGFLTEGFKAYKAAKEREATGIPTAPAEPAAPPAQPQLSAEVQTVLKLFNGTIIKSGTE